MGHMGICKNKTKDYAIACYPISISRDILIQQWGPFLSIRLNLINVILSIRLFGASEIVSDELERSKMFERSLPTPTHSGSCNLCLKALSQGEKIVGSGTNKNEIVKHHDLRLLWVALYAFWFTLFANFFLLTWQMMHCLYLLTASSIFW